MNRGGDDPVTIPRAEIITVGSELVQGLIPDTNSAWLSRRLAEIGIPCDFHTSVGDDAGRLEAAVRLATSRAEVVLIAGGLGPTADDITREAVAQAAGVPLVLHRPSLDVIASRFAKWGRGMSANNRRQARLPGGAEVMPNANGTAPGFIVTIGRATAYVFPGVPRELYAMFDEQALPRLRRLGGGGLIRVRRIHCFGPGESAVDEKIRDLMSAEGNPNVGLLVSNYIITVKITARGGDAREVDALIDATEREVRARLGDIVFGADGETMAEATARGLLSRGLTVATAESCTGGFIAKELTDVAGISASFLAGVVAYANDAKCDLVGVPAALIGAHGAVSEEVARALAEGVRERAAADVAVSTTGIAGPTGGTDEKPVGLVFIALSDADGTDVRRCTFHGSRDRIRTRATLTALDMIRRWTMTRDA
jgi:nicotinamide-nucleotide amidase